MFAITNNGVDLAFVVLIIIAIVSFLGAEFYRDRHNVKFSSLRQMFNEMDKDFRNKEEDK